MIQTLLHSMSLPVLGGGGFVVALIVAVALMKVFKFALKVALTLAVAVALLLAASAYLSRAMPARTAAIVAEGVTGRA